LHIPNECHDKWELLCNFLDLEYPAIPFPEINEFEITELSFNNKANFDSKELKFDNLPWIIQPNNYLSLQSDNNKPVNYNNSLILDKSTKFDFQQWKLRDDTFPSNLALFRPNNVKITENNIGLHFNYEVTPVRSYTSAALVTVEKYLYGKFKVELCPSNVSGLITGVFLHRNGPHQEIDIEFLGKDPTKMLINVFFNPGMEGSRLEYGYRGTPVVINLGFNASEDYHLYEIHWESDRIRWIVDGAVVYERIMYVPTPIPYLPMEFNINLWHSQSEKLAGKLNSRDIPTRSSIKKVEIEFQ
ncbi:family 16 glycosylhydrolase, partial [Enterococcus sp. 3H8_DIV0648]|uniref:family 16 glycosylhydrolase n=2 Tax=Enterococcus TaxID=1350 RepID=UPI000B710625